MAVVKITTPDGQVPSASKPVEGVDYTVVGGPPLSTGDLIRVTSASGSEDFCRYTAPPEPQAVQPKTLAWGDLALYLIGLLGGGATGRAALGAIIKSCTASALGGDNFFAVYFQGQTTFTKAEFTAVLADVSTGIVSNGAKTSVANNWPT